MSDNIQNEIRIPLNPEVIGKIDLLIESGLYKDHLDFLDNAINHLLDTHQATINNFKVKNNFVIGIVSYSSKELEKIVVEGKRLHIKVIGSLHFDASVTPELAERAIEKINMAGILKAPEPVKRVLVDKQFTLLGNKRKLFLKGPSENILDWNDDSGTDLKE